MYKQIRFGVESYLLIHTYTRSFMTKTINKTECIKYEKNRPTINGSALTIYIIWKIRISLRVRKIFR